MIDPAELRRLAEAALHKNGSFIGAVNLSPDERMLYKALSPAAVLALLDRLAAAEAVVAAAWATKAASDSLGTCIDEFGNDAPSACSEWFDALLMRLGEQDQALAALRQPPAATGGEGA